MLIIFLIVPVVQGEDLVGIVTGRDLRFETKLDQPVSTIMTPKERLVTVEEGAVKVKSASCCTPTLSKKCWSSTINSSCAV